MSLSYRDVLEILEIIDSSTMDELVLEREGAKLVVGFHRDGPAATAVMEPEGLAAAAAPSADRAAAAPGDAAAELDARSGDWTAVRAPMVGTLYRAPSPGEANFVEIGDTVAAGDPLALIEVMKLYTTIEAEQAGRIVEIAAANATLVEYDQILFFIEPVD